VVSTLHQRQLASKKEKKQKLYKETSVQKSATTEPILSFSNIPKVKTINARNLNSISDLSLQSRPNLSTLYQFSPSQNKIENIVWKWVPFCSRLTLHMESNLYDLSYIKRINITHFYLHLYSIALRTLLRSPLKLYMILTSKGTRLHQLFLPHCNKPLILSRLFITACILTTKLSSLSWTWILDTQPFV